MRKYTPLFIVAALVLAIPAVLALDVNEISSCMDITESGNYALTGNVSSDGTCFNIKSSDVVLDCNDHTINYGDSGKGIGFHVASEDRLENIVIKNCNIVKNLNGNRFIANSENYGIYLEDVHNSSILDNTVKTNGIYSNVGVYLSKSTGNVIESNDINSDGITVTQYGIFLREGSSFNKVIDNVVSTGGVYVSFGIFALMDSDFNTIIGNKITTVGRLSPTILMRSSSNNLFVDNSVNPLGLGSVEWRTDTIVGGERPVNNTAIDLELVKNDMVIDIESHNGISLKSISENEISAENPEEHSSLGKYVEIKNLSADAWALLRIHYDDSELGNLGESTLRIWEVDKSTNNWEEYDSEESGVNILDNEVFAKLITFSTFGIFGSEITDSDGDGIVDEEDMCSETVLPELHELRPNHYADIDGDGIFEVNTGSAKKPVIVDSEFTLEITQGCGCSQILDLKPGKNKGEGKFGCTKGTMQNFLGK